MGTSEPCTQRRTTRDVERPARDLLPPGRARIRALHVNVPVPVEAACTVRQNLATLVPDRRPAAQAAR